MANRIYTQADYDKVTAMDQAYQAKKDSYTPEQQKNIEKMISDAYTTVSNRIEESKNMISDMWNDEKWNTWAMYWDWRKEVVNQAPVQQPKTTVKSNPNPKPNSNPDPNPEQPTVTPEVTVNSNNEWSNKVQASLDWLNKNFDPYTTKPSDVVNMMKEQWRSNDDINLFLNKRSSKVQDRYNELNSWYTQEELEKYWLIWPQTEPSVNEVPAQKTKTDTKTKTKTYNPVWDILNWINTIKTEVPAFVNSIPTRAEWVVSTVKTLPQFVEDVKTTKAWIDKIKNWNLVEKATWVIDTITSLPATLKSTNDMLEWVNKITNNKISTNLVKRILDNGWRIGTDWTIYDKSGKVITRLSYPISL